MVLRVRCPAHDAVTCAGTVPPSLHSLHSRRRSSTEEVKNKLVPHANELLDALKAQDGKGTGLISHEHLKAAVKATGVFLTAAEIDQLIAVAPHEPPGGSDVNYVGLVDVLLGKSERQHTEGGAHRVGAGLVGPHVHRSAVAQARSRPPLA